MNNRIPRVLQKTKTGMTEKHKQHQSTAERVLERFVTIMDRWESGAPLGELLPHDVDGRIVSNCVLGVFRHRAVLDWVVDRFCRRRVRPRLRQVLRWALFELLYMAGVPAPVTVDVSVDYVKRRFGNRSESGFVNAVLRKVIGRTPDELLARAHPGGVPEYVRRELSPELFRQWSGHLSTEQMATVSALLVKPACTTVRLRDCDARPDDSLEELARFDWCLSARMFRCMDAPAFFACPGFKVGQYYVQDPATLLAPSLLAVQPGETVADLCAAPGGKSLLIADAQSGDGMLVCADIGQGRLARLRRNLAVAVSEPSFVCADATAAPFRPGTFAAVLLDVPCSNTGVIRRHPDVRWRFDAGRLRTLCKLQKRLLREAVRLLRPDGRLVYSTCSIEPEENTEQVARFLREQEGNFVLVAERSLFPNGAHDGAYAALLRKKHG